MSMDELAEELNLRGAPPPGRKGGRASKTRRRGEASTRWTRNAVRAILRNPKYTGALVWNRRSRGKYHTLLADGKVTGKPDKKDRANDPATWIIVPGTHEALVSQELFDRVQDRLATNRGGTGPKLGSYLFSGLVTCTNCGRTMNGITMKGRRYYRCHKYDGDTRQVVCGYAAVSEEFLLERFDRTLQEEVLNRDRLRAIEEEMRRRTRPSGRTDAVEALRARLDTLLGHIDQGNANLAILPADRLPGVVAKLREWEEERDRLRVEIGRRQGPGLLDGFQQSVEEFEALLWRWRELVEDGDAVLLREIIRDTIERTSRWNGTPARPARGRTTPLRAGCFTSGNTCCILRYTTSRAGARPAGRPPPRRSAAARR